jgi:hypothetical protein
VVYKGTVAEQPDAFELDGHHLIDFSTHYGIFPGCGTSIPFAVTEGSAKSDGRCC